MALAGAFLIRSAPMLFFMFEMFEHRALLRGASQCSFAKFFSKMKHEKSNYFFIFEMFENREHERQGTLPLRHISKIKNEKRTTCFCFSKCLKIAVLPDFKHEK